LSTALPGIASNNDSLLSLSARPLPPAYDWSIRIIIIAVLSGMVYHIVWGEVLDSTVEAIEDLGWSWSLLQTGYIWAVFGLMLIGVRTVLWMQYRPFAPATEADAPSMTVIIPAYNEGAMVAQTIDSVASAHYPRDRLEIFAVDDGSKDDTWQHIQAAAARHPGLVTALRFTANRGKRAALEAGFRKGRGEIAVTIDSDSIIDRNTLLAMAGPFRKPHIGAVAGKVSVLNRFKGILPRMVHVRFVLTFDMMRAVQSMYGTVYCTPGALSAYRMSVVRKVLDAWVNQRFLGVACTIGEDRALTNWMLKEGFDVVYQRTAVVHTLMPTTYSKLCKMMLRWDRSYIREELRFAGIMWRRPLKALPIVIADFVVNNLRFPVTYLSLATLAVLIFNEPVMLLRVMAAIGIMSLFYMLYYLRSERSFEFIYGVLYSYFAFFTLFWIFPYALVTARSRGWMTR